VCTLERGTGHGREGREKIMKGGKKTRGKKKKRGLRRKKTFFKHFPYLCVEDE